MCARSQVSLLLRRVLHVNNNYKSKHFMCSSSKTLISDIVNKYNLEYENDNNNNNQIISAAQSIPNFKYLYIVQLIHPFNNKDRINIIGIKQSSITEQDEIAIEIRNLLHLIKPQTLIVQLSKNQYKTHLNNMDINDINNLIPIQYSLSSLLSQQYLRNSARIGLHLINYICMNNKIRMNPYLYALLYANNDKNNCNFIENIILGDIQYQKEEKIGSSKGLKYMMSTTYKERKTYGSYPGIKELLFSLNSVDGVYEWINLNKNIIKLKEKEVNQFAIDMQQKLEIGKDILETTAKSMAYYTYKSAKESNNILVLCNIFTMLSLPMYFGKVTKQEIKQFENNSSSSIHSLNNINKKILYKGWIFNYWNGMWWTLCFIHTIFGTGIYNLDYPYLLQFGIGFPIIYPTIYILISFRSRHRVRKLQKIIIKQQEQQQIYKQKSNKLAQFD